MRNLIVGVLAFFAASAVHAAAYDELNDKQKAVIQAGKQVFVSVDADGSAWPKMYVFQRIDSTPEEAAAVFTDFEGQAKFVPKILKAKISKRIDPRTVEVDFEMEVPVVANEKYTTRNAISSYDGGASYRVDWTLVRASSTKATVGNVRFERLGTGTLMAWYNFVTPGSSFAGMFKGKAEQQAKDTGVAMLKQIEKERKDDQPLLQRQLEALRAALSAR